MKLGVAIMAGGEGQRLRAVTGVLPKALAPLAGGTLLSHQLQRVAPLDAPVVVLGRVGVEALRIALGEHGTLLVEDSPLGTAGALAHLPAGPEQWLVLNVDHISDVDLPALLAAHDERATAVTTTISHTVPEGVVDVERGQLTAYHERPTLRFEVTVGMYLFSAALLRDTLDGRPWDMPQLIRALAPVQAWHHGGTWLDAGTPERLARAEAWLTRG